MWMTLIYDGVAGLSLVWTLSALWHLRRVWRLPAPDTLPAAPAENRIKCSVVIAARD
jgi:hypothetical protein